jgi:hypothetical protein
VFYIHVDYDGNVSGRGAIVYALDPNLCGVAVLTRQVNEQVNFLQHIAGIYSVAESLRELAARRFHSAFKPTPPTITQKIDEFIRALPPKIQPAAGKAEAEQFRAAYRALKAKHLAFADVDVAGFPKIRRWGPSGEEDLSYIPGVVPIPTVTKFKPTKWSKPFKLKEGGWDSTLGKKEPYLRSHDSERLLMEYLAKELPPNASGVIKIYSEYPVCPSCTGVIEQFYWLFDGRITLLVTSGS